MGEENNIFGFLVFDGIEEEDRDGFLDKLISKFEEVPYANEKSVKELKDAKD